MWSGSYISPFILRMFSICSVSEYINFLGELCCHICIKNYLPPKEGFSCRKQSSVSDIMTLAGWRTPRQTFLSDFYFVPRWLLRGGGAAHVWVVSRGGQQRAFTEATVLSLMTCVKVGVQERVNSDTDRLGSSSLKDFQDPIQREQRSEPELRRNLSLLLRWRKGWVWIRPEMTLLKGSHRVGLCSGGPRYWLTAVWSIFTHNVLTGRSWPLLLVTAYNLQLELIILIDWNMKENNLPEQLLIDGDCNTFIDSSNVFQLYFRIQTVLNLKHFTETP